MNIDWQLPKTRTGFLGGIDKLIGPGATKAEKNIQLYLPFLAGVVMLTYAWSVDLGWSLSQFVVAGMLTVDIAGGIITNATSSAKRWFHREGEGFKQHMSFIALHFAQLTLFSWAFLSMDVVWVLLVGGYMMFACAFVLKTPLYLQRPIALSLYSLAILLSLYGVQSAVGLEWFLPLLFLKLLVSHILREEPYRPINNGTQTSEAK